VPEELEEGAGGVVEDEESAAPGVCAEPVADDGGESVEGELRLVGAVAT
jgi:hypothetical protein